MIIEATQNSDQMVEMMLSNSKKIIVTVQMTVILQRKSDIQFPGTVLLAAKQSGDGSVLNAVINLGNGLIIIIVGGGNIIHGA